MASQKDQIQALITEIDDVLQKASPRLPWVMSGDTAHQRRVLERVRNFLVTLQKRLGTGEVVGQPEPPPNLLAYDIYYQQPPSAASSQSTEMAVNPQEMTAQQMLQIVMQEMGYLRTGMMQSMQAEMESLRQEREVLVQEVRQLEAQRRGYSPALHLDQQQQLGEFLQVLMGRLQESLPQQVAQSLQGMPIGQVGAIAPSPQPTQAHSDQLLVNLDTTIRIVFESLQRDIKAYQDSLAQGLDRMHTLGQQGEMMFSALVTHLAEKLGQGASSYMQVSGQPPSEAAMPLPDSLTQTSNSAAGLSLIAAPSTSSSITSNPAEAALSDQPGSAVGFPYAGAEIPPLADFSAQTPPSSVDAAIDSWLDSVAASINEISAEPDLTSLDMADLDFAELDLNTFSAEEFGSSLESDIIPPADLASQAPQVLAVGSPSSHENATNIDAALKLLEQLSAQPEAAQDLETGTSESPAVARTDLDEFYESLFGPGAVTPKSPLEAPSPSVEAASPSDPTLGWNLIPEEASSAIPQVPSEFSEPPSELVSSSDPTLGWDLISEAVAVQSNATVDQESFDVPSEKIFSEEIFQEPFANDLEFDFQIDNEASSDLEELSVHPEDAVQPENTISALTDLIETESVGGYAPLGMDMGAPPSESLMEAASLFIDETSAAFFQASSPSSGDLTTSSTEGYILASPEENLLPSNESFNEPVSGLWLDETTLSNLDADLSNLENSFGDQPLAPAEVETNFSELYLGMASEPESITPSVTAVETSAEQVPILEDWADASLDDFAAALPQTVVPETGTDAVASATGGDALIDFPADDEDAFTLEGIGDLFVDVPSTTPSFSTESQPMVSGKDLQGGAGLPEDSPLAFSLEGMDDLFADAPAVSASPIPPPIAPPATEPPAFTLEGMDDLFAEAPSIAVTPVPPPAVAALSVDQPSTFTLEGMDDLFADVPSTNSASLSSSEPLAELTLGGIDDFFADLPAAESSVSDPASVAVGQPAPFSLEEVGGVFSEKPLNVGSAVPDQPGAFALEQQHGLFVEVPIPTPQPQSSETDLEKKTGLN